MNLKLAAIAFALCGFGFAHLASADDGYSVNAGRLQGNLQCSLSKADGGNFDCNIHVKAQAQVTIGMTAEYDNGGKILGFAGMDRFQEGKLNYTLAVGAGGAKDLRGVSLITDNMDGSSTTINASIAVSESTKLLALNISPITVVINDADTVNVELGFVLYGDMGDNIVAGKDIPGLQNMLLGKVRPLVLALSAAKK